MDQNPSSSPQQISNEVSAQAKGFMGSILDFSFESFVTPKIAKLVYFLMLVGVVVGSLFVLLGGLLQGGKNALFALIMAPLVLILGAIISRVYVELVMLAFKMLETLQKIESKQR